MRLFIAILIFVIPLQASAAMVSSFDSLVGVWTGFERFNTDTTYVATDAEVEESCKNLIHVYHPNFTYEFIGRKLNKKKQVLIAIVVKPLQACEFKKHTTQCPVELTIYGPKGAVLLSQKIIAQSAFSWNSNIQVDVTSIALELDSELPLADSKPDNLSLYRCPMDLADIDDWYASNPVPNGGADISHILTESIGTSNTTLDKENVELARAANNGDMEAARTRGVRYIIAYFIPMFGESSSSKGIALLKMAAESGDMFAHSALGHAYVLGPILVGEPFEWENVIRHHSIAANAGIADSLNSLAVMHVLGKTKVPDFALASELFMEAADKGSVSAYFNLAALMALIEPDTLTNYGFTLYSDPLTAMAYAKYAMDKGIPAAQGLWQHLSRTRPEFKNQAISKADTITRAMAKLKPTKDPSLQMNFTFKATDTGIRFDDADIIYNYEFSIR